MKIMRQPFSTQNYLENTNNFNVDKNCDWLTSNFLMRSSSSFETSNSTNRLLNDFQPTHLDVVCGRGKTSRGHKGNINFIRVIKNNLNSYLKIRSREGKSELIRSIVESIRYEASIIGGVGFVKVDEKNGCWIEIGDQLAREKVGHALRDMLRTKRRLVESNPKSFLYIPLHTGQTSEKHKREALLRKQKELFLYYIKEDLGDEHEAMTRYVTDFYNRHRQKG
jgi:hypothetical protein